MRSNNNLPNFMLVKHLSHVFLDGEIGGTPLDEGSTLSVLLPSFTDFFEWLDRESSANSTHKKSIVELAEKSFSQHSRAGLNKVMQQFKYLHETDEKLKTIKRQFELTRLADEIISTYIREGEVYLPGGWRGKVGSPGHAMTYRLVRNTKNGKTMLMVYNTGAGIHYHGQAVHSSGTMGYHPVYAFEFECDTEADRKRLNHVLATLLAEQAELTLDNDAEQHQSSKQGAERIYEDILDVARVYFAATGVDEALLPRPILGQRNGTCVLKSYTQAMRSQFETRGQYRQFFFAYRMYLLSEHIDENKINKTEIIFPGYRDLLKQCLANTARMLDQGTKSDTNEWSVEDSIRKRIIAHINIFDQVLKKSKHKAVRKINASLGSRGAMTMYPELPSANVEEGGVHEERLSEMDSESIKSMTFFTALKKINDDQDLNEEKLAEIIEKFCTHFSSIKTPLLAGDHPSTSDILREMTKFQDRYSRQSTGKLNTPRSIVINMALMYFMDRLCKEEAIKAGNFALSCYPFYKSRIQNLVECLTNSPFVGTRDPNLDKLAQTIYDFYQAIGKKEVKKDKIEKDRKALESAKTGVYANDGSVSEECKRIKYYCNILKQAPRSELDEVKAMWHRDQHKPGLLDALKRSKFFTSNAGNLDDMYMYSFFKLDTEFGPNHLTYARVYTMYQYFEFQKRIELFQHTQASAIAVSADRYSKCELARNEGRIYLKYVEQKNDYSRSYITFGTIIDIEQTYIRHQWLLNGKIIDGFPSNNPRIKRVLESHHDANQYDSEELPFVSESSTYLAYGYDLAEHRREDHRNFNKEFSYRSLESRLENKLHHLHLNPCGTAVLLLSELAQEPGWMLDKDYQQFIELSLFKPGVLLHALNNENDFWPILEKIYKSNLFSDDPTCPDEGAWYALNLAVKMSTYALLSERHGVTKLSDQARNACLGWNKRILDVTSARLKNKKPNTDEIKSYYIQLIDSLSALPTLTSEQTKALMVSYLNYVMIPETLKKENIIEGDRTRYILERALGVLKNETKQKLNLSNDIYNTIAAYLKESFDFGKKSLVANHAESKFPKIIYNDGDNNKLIVNFETRKIIYKGGELGYIPPSIMGQTAYKYVFGDQVVIINKMISNNGSRENYYATKNGELYRVIRDRSSYVEKTYIQKKIGVTWYTLAAPSFQIAYTRKLAFYAQQADENKIYNQKKYWYWMADKENYIIEDENLKQCRYRVLNGKMTKIDSDGKEYEVIIATNSGLNSQLNHLESPDFIECLKQNGSNDIRWHLPRYQLTFIEVGRKLYTEDKRYYVVYSDYHSTCASGLVLKAVNGLDPDKFIMPMQPIYLSPLEKLIGKSASIEFNYNHDLGHVVPENALSNALRNNSERILGVSGWNFEGSEQIAEYTVKENTLIPKTGADQVYLAYIYLMQKKYAKAKECLDQCQYQGTIEEMRRLSWMVTNTPLIVDSTCDPIVNSKHLTIQMQAINAMITLKEQFKGCRNVTIDNRDKSDTTWYKNKELTQLQKFIDRLNVQCEQIYRLYQNRKNNIPKKLRLTSEQESHVLGFMQAEYELGVKLSKSTGAKYLGVSGKKYGEKFNALTGGSELAVARNTGFVLTNRSERVVCPLKLDYYESDISSGLIYEANPLDIKELNPWMPQKTFCRLFAKLYYQVCNKPEMKTVIKQFCEAYYAKMFDKVGSDQPNGKLYDDKNETVKMLLGILLGKIDDESYSAVLSKQVRDEENERNRNRENKYNFNSALAAVLKKIATVSASRLSKKSITYPYRETNYFNVPFVPEISQAKVSETPKAVMNLKFDRLIEGTVLHKLQESLQENEKVFENRVKLNLEQLPSLSGKTLAEQNEILNQLDHSLLKLKKKYDKEQIDQYKIYKIWELDNQQTSLAAKLSELEHGKNELIEGLKVLLKERNKDVVREVGKHVVRPTIKSLIKNYAKYKLEDYKALGYNTKTASYIKQAISEILYFQNEIRINKQINDAIEKDKKEKSEASHLKVVSELLSKNHAQYEHQAIFQYTEKLGLYSKQARVLELLTQNSPGLVPSYLIKLIMGGGKTKVIMPLLLFTLANGKELPMVLVPDASLNTNFTDLRSTSSSAFQQGASIFKFDRDTSCESVKLRYLYEKFETAINEKSYFVSSPSCLQSLELKFYEILFYKNHPKEPLTNVSIQEINEQLLWLSRIRQLLKTRATVVIDEAHLLLHIRKELNYSIGNSKIINANISETVSELYKWFYKTSVLLPNGNSIKFTEILKSPNPIMDEKTVEAVIQDLAKAFCHGEPKPAYVKGLLAGQLTAEQLENYLLGKLDSKQLEEVDIELDEFPHVQARWLILREQFSNLLKSTLRSKLFENYGPDLKNNENPFAIPYRANNMPTPYVFANILESMNYTSQMFYAQGIKREYLVALLRAWKNQAHVERQSNPASVSSSERKFNYIFSASNEKLSLLHLDLKNEKLISDLHQKYGNHSVLLHETLKVCLSSMKLDEGLLRSDPLNLVAMFNKAVGFSATPENHRTYHPKIAMSYETSFLIESQVMDYLKTKKTKIVDWSGMTAGEFFESCIKENKKVTAVLDCGSRLRGLYNIDAVKLLEKYCTDKKFILFYDESDLYAWKVHGGDNQKPIKLTSTDPEVIQSELDGCLPNERFTYFDQEHTLGVDIKQDPNAYAIVTVDIKTTLSAFLQAVMRMRQLAFDQHVVIVLDPEVKIALEKDHREKDSLDKLFELLESNQTKQLEMDHFTSALKKIRNMIREDLDARLLNESEPVKRDKFYLIVEDFFLDHQDDDMIKIYKNQAKVMETKSILDSYSTELITTWRLALQKAGMDAYTLAETSKQMTDAISEVSKQSEKVCKQNQLFPTFLGGRETQQQKEQLKESEKKVEEKRQDERKNRSVVSKQVDLNWIDDFILTGTIDKVIGSKIDRISDLVKINKDEGWAFNENLLATHNLLYAHASQDKNDIYNTSTKLCTAMLYLKQDKKLVGILLIPEEVEKLQNELSKKSSPLIGKASICTLSGDHYTKPLALTEDEIIEKQILLEQASLFNGRVDILASLVTDHWMSDHVDKKINFLKEKVKPALGIDENKMERLDSRYMKLDEYIDHWARHADDTIVDPGQGHTVPLACLKRMDKILPYLNDVRTKEKIFTIDQLSDDMHLLDALRVVEYQNSMALLRLLKENKTTDAISLFEKMHGELPIGILNYCTPDKSIVMTESEIMKFHDLLKNKTSKIDWIRQVCASNVFVSMLSQATFDKFMKHIGHKEFVYYLKRILKNNEDRAIIAAKYTLQSTQSLTDEGFLFVAKETKMFGKAFREKIVSIKSPLAAIYCLQDCGIEQDDMILKMRNKKYYTATIIMHRAKKLDYKTIQNKEMVAAAALFDLIGIEGNIQITEGLNNDKIVRLFSKIYDDVNSDVELKNALSDHYKSKTTNLSEKTCNGAFAILNIRDKYLSLPQYNKDDLNKFTRKSLAVLIEFDGSKQKDSAITEKYMMRRIEAIGYQCFKHRHLAIRIIADVLLSLTGVGFFVFIIRKASGNSFFFANAKTHRQIEFETSLKNSLNGSENKKPPLSKAIPPVA